MERVPNVDRASTKPSTLVGALDSPALQPIEGLLKLVAVFAALITFLGTPAVILQFVRFRVPLQFLTRDQALRAGIMPALSLIALGFAMHWALSNPTKLLKKLRALEFGGPLAGEAGISGLGVTDTSRWLTAVTVMALMLTPLAFIWNYGLHFLLHHLPKGLPQILESMGWGPLQRALWAAAIIFSASIIAVIIGRTRLVLQQKAARYRIVKFAAAFVRLVIDFFHNLASRFRHPLAQGAVFAVILSGLFSLYLLSQKYIYGGTSWLRDGLWGGLLQGLAYGCLITSFAVLAGALTQLTDPATRRQAQTTAYGAMLIIYFPLAALYASQWYPYIPYAAGGGRPTEVAVWVESKNLPKSVQQVLGCAEDGELKRCENAYLVHFDSDRAVLADHCDAKRSSFSLVLSKDSIKAINSRRSLQPISSAGSYSHFVGLQNLIFMAYSPCD